MFRSVAMLMHVLSVVAPQFQPQESAAKHLSQLGVQYDVDPLLVVADVENESRWNSSAINGSSGTRGLGQIQPYNFKACAEQHPETMTHQCMEVMEQLLDWEFNLTTLFQYFANARAFCKEQVHSGLAVYWLQTITGYDKVRGTRCGHRKGKRMAVPKKVLQLMKRRRELEKL